MVIIDQQQYVDKFEFHIVEKTNPHRDFFVLHKTEKSNYVRIDGTTGVALAHGLYMYVQR